MNRRLLFWSASQANALELEVRTALVPLERERDEPVEQLRVVDPGRLEELRIHARRGEAGNGVQLVDDDLTVLANEEVDPRHALALSGDERVDRALLHKLDRLLRQLRRDDEIHAALVVLGRVVVPVVLERVDATRQRRDRWRLPVAEHAALDLHPG